MSEHQCIATYGLAKDLTLEGQIGGQGQDNAVKGLEAAKHKLESHASANDIFMEYYFF